MWELHASRSLLGNFMIMWCRSQISISLHFEFLTPIPAWYSLEHEYSRMECLHLTSEGSTHDQLPSFFVTLKDCHPAVSLFIIFLVYAATHLSWTWTTTSTDMISVIHAYTLRLFSARFSFSSHFSPGRPVFSTVSHISLATYYNNRHQSKYSDDIRDVERWKL